MKNINLEKYEIDKNRLPRHIAIIMDGNGRWAEERGLPRIEGHRAGVETVRDIVESCGIIGIKYLTLYTFSEENWRRPLSEVRALLNLFSELLDKELPELHKNNVKVNFIGRLHKLPGYLRRKIRKMEEVTENNTGLNLVLAVSYGGRSELVDAINKMLKEGLKRINSKLIFKYLYYPELPEPDLMIRTAGELRISNFLLYQIAYTELWFTKVLWPDFRTEHLLLAIKDYQQRVRKFGGLA